MIRPIARRLFPLRSGDWKVDGPRVEHYLNESIYDILDQLNTQVQGVGESLGIGSETNATLKPTNAIHRVGGTGSIQYIQPPRTQAGVESDGVTARFVSSFTGPLFLLPLGAWTTVDTGTGAGSIRKASTAVVGQLMTLVFDGEEWWPSY